MRKVLFISYAFPPFADASAQRPLKFASYLSQYGWEPTVITAACSDGIDTDGSPRQDAPGTIRVLRVPMVNQPIARAIAGLIPGTPGRRLATALSEHLRDRYAIPDRFALWRVPAVRAGMRVFEEHGFDAIFATGYPWTSLVVGHEIARATGRPLVVELTERWLSPDRDLVRAIITAARYVVSPTASITRWLTEIHPAIPADTFVSIHDGFDRDDFATPGETSDASDGVFRVLYAGAWEEEHGPSALYDSIDWIRRSHPALLHRVEVIAAGFQPGEAARRGLDTHIIELGPMALDQIVSLARTAHVLFLPMTDPERHWTVPARLYEYLASGRPVLALTHPDKEIDRVLRRVGGGVTVSPEDPGTLFETLETIFRTRAFEVPPLNVEELAAFERRRLTARLAAVLDDAVRETQAPHTAVTFDAIGLAEPLRSTPLCRAVSQSQSERLPIG